jgi:microcystin-dependent protein
MDNNLPAIPALTGGFVDPGGGNIDRVPDANADLLGGSSGQSSVGLNLNNIPQHSHTLRNGNTQYSVVRVDPSIDPPATTGLGPTASGQAQYLNDSGGIRAPLGTTFGTPFGIMNPFLTLNYIIRSGRPAF